MSAAPPVVGGDLLERARAAVRTSLGLGQDDPVPADALVRIFARLADIVADRIDAAPDKNLVAFLDLIGIRRRAPQPARAAVTFTAAAGAPAAVRVPAGTQVAAQPLEGETEPTMFESERDLVVISPTPSALHSREPGRDRESDLVALLTPGDDSRAGHDPFAGDLVPVRRLALGCGEALALGPDQEVTLSVTLQEMGPWAAALSWSVWDGAAWQPVRSSGDLDAGISLYDVPLVPRATLGGREDRWVAARLGTSLPRNERTPVEHVAVWAAPADAARAGARDIDPAGELAPFGVAGEEDTFALAAEDAFAKPGAQVSLVVTAAGDGPQDDAPPLEWSYWDGAEWQVMADVDDGTSSLTADGVVAFSVPVDWAPSPWPEGEQPADALRRLRVRRIGDYRRAPVVAGLEVRATWPVPRINSVAVSAKARRDTPGVLPDAVLAGTTVVDPSADFAPFGARPAPGATCAIASDEALLAPPAGATAGVALDVEVTSARTGTFSAVLRWELWDQAAAAWSKLGDTSATAVAGASFGFTDTTQALTKSGTITFSPPPSIGTTAIAGQTHRWLRVRLISGDYGKDATYTKSGSGYDLTPATLVPPSIASLRFRYDRSTTQARETTCLVGIGDAFSAPGAGEFEPFPPMEEPNPALHIGFPGPLPNATISLWLDAAEQPGGDEPPAVAWEYWDGEGWNDLVARDETLGLQRAGLVTFVGPADLAPREDFGTTARWVRARGVAGRSKLLRLLANTTWVSEGSAVSGEVLGSSTGEPGLALATTRCPVLEGETVEVRELERPPAPELAALGPDAVGEPADDGVWVRWSEVTDFVGSAPRDRHYTLDRLAGVVTFGDGRRGLVPPTGRGNVRASYRTGGGAHGNRAAGEIAQLKTAVPYIERAVNPLAAGGGADVEPLASVRERGPRELRHGGRAVAPADYEDLAVATVPAVARALAVPASSNADAGRVGLVVVPGGTQRRPAPGPAVLSAVEAAIQARLPVTAGVWVSGPGWLEVTVEAELAAVAPEAAGAVQVAAVAALDRFLHPLTGGQAGAGWPFAREPHRSDLVALLEAVDGVDHVAWLSVTATDVVPAPAPQAFLVASGRHAITIVGS